MTSVAPRSILAIDAGQSSIKIRHSIDGVATDWTTSGIRTDHPLMPQIAAVLSDAERRGYPAAEVGVGASGLTDAGTDAEGLMRVAARGGARSLSIAHDSITAFLGALGGVLGSIVLAHAFRASVLRRIPVADVRVGHADPLDGAALLPAVAGESPLRSLLVRVARPQEQA
ncbi:MAG: hypothetical protein JST33_01275 [Actinobacteria bacterium]|nr:hypothetical protein [Actinomycetota bacterium]